MARLRNLERITIRRACQASRACYLDAVRGTDSGEAFIARFDNLVVSAMELAFRRDGDIALAMPEYVKEALRAMYGSVAKSASDQPMSTVRSAFLDGIRKLIGGDRKTLRKSFDQAGISHENPALIETVVGTQVQMASNASEWIHSQEQPTLWGYEYLTRDDEKVRYTHVPFHKVRYPKDHEFWDKYAPPNGWRCRCRLVPIYGESTIVEFDGVPIVDRAFLFNPGKLFS